ncbi:MAG TPA: dihydrolipoyl dehydrogenase [Bacteroidales bacterium]|nr:dihydrolipoyl dehydrogenase [Bacteroidales bacterium]
MKYDLGIIGGGPAGYNAAEKAAENGLKTILFEKKAVGGVCLNEGCIPTKTLLYSAKMLDQAKAAYKYGIQVSETPTFELEKIINRKDKVVKQMTAGVKMKLDKAGVTVIQGEATLSGESEGSIRILCGEEVYQTTYVLLCTGSETVIPPIKGLSEIDYWTSKEALESITLPKSLAIIGGGVIGMEFASFFNSMGVKVHVIEMLPEILGAMDKETSKMLRTIYSKKGIEFYLENKVIEVGPSQVIVEKNGKTSVIEAEKILMSVGRRPITKGLGLETLNIEMDRTAVKVNEFMQTSHPRVYASGDITGFSMLAHTAYREGEVAVNRITGLDDFMSYRAIPGVVYTNPEIAGVGETEESLKTQKKPYRVLKLPMAYSGRFVAENEQGNGLCKLIVDEFDRIVGCHLLGNPASEIIVVAGMAIENGYTIEEFQKIVFPHPTVAEIIRESLNA